MISKKLSLSYLSFLLIINLSAIFAPILAATNSSFLNEAAKHIYNLYSFFCHQFHTRSIHIFDYQYSWCARDTGIWLGMLMVSILIYKTKWKGVKWYWILPLFIPLILDGGIQTIATLQVIDGGSLATDPFYISNNFFRFVTGSLFGIGTGMFISPRIFFLKIGGSKLLSTFKMVFIAFFLSLLLYTGMIFLWRYTSNRYLPTDYLDSQAKVQSKDFFQRRLNGI